MQAMKRRRLLESLVLAPLAARAAAPEAARITVTSLEIFRVKVNRRGNWVLVRLRTSAGITGIGDASHHNGEEATQVKLIERYFERLKGRGIFDIEALRRGFDTDIARDGVSSAVAWSALEQCLWDIRGKAFGVPVHELLGGLLNPRVRNYANINRSVEDRTPAGFAAMAGKAVQAGFDAVKLAPFDDMPRGLTDAAVIARHMQAGIDCAAAVRQAIGPRRDLLVDVHNHFDLKDGLELARRLEPLRLYWLEETTPEPADLAAVRRAAKMPTAGGENLYGVRGFYPYIASGAVDIVMPDVKYSGGVLELKKIAALAEGAGLQVSPHGPASPVGNAAAVQVCATLPNLTMLEFAYGEVPWRAEVIDPPEALDRGYTVLTGRPGFGVELNEKTLRAQAVQ